MATITTTTTQTLQDKAAFRDQNVVKFQSVQPDDSKAVDSDTLHQAYHYASFAQAAYFGTKALALKSLKQYSRKDTMASRLKDMMFLSDSDALLVGGITVDSECFAALMDDGELVLAFRGTEIIPGSGIWSDVVTDICFLFTPISKLHGNCSDKSGGKVHRGFLQAFNCLADKEQAPPSFPSKEGVPRDINQLIWAMQMNNPATKINRITCVGHSLGGALATLAAYWCCKVGTLQVPVSCFTYGSPRVGNQKFAEQFDRLLSHSGSKSKNIRVVHRDDPVPALPPALLWGYYHVGTGILLCKPAIKLYGLSNKAAEGLKEHQYIAVKHDRPLVAWPYIRISHHFIWNYLLAMEAVMDKKAAQMPASLALAFSAFNSMTLMQDFLMMAVEEASKADANGTREVKAAGASALVSK